MSLPGEAPLPPNPLKMEDTNDGNLFDLYTGRCLDLEYLVTPFTLAVKHCPEFPLCSSNYARGMWTTQDDVRKKQLASDGTGTGDILKHIDEHNQGLVKSQKLHAPDEIFSANYYSGLVDHEENTSQDPTIDVDKLTRQIKIFNPILGKTITFYPANIPVCRLSEKELEKITKPVENAVVSNEGFRSRYAKLNYQYGGNKRIDHQDQPSVEPASIDKKLPEAVEEQKKVKQAQGELKQKPVPSYRPKPKIPKKAKLAPQITPTPVTPPVLKRGMAQNLGKIKLPDPIPCPKSKIPKKAKLAPQITPTPVTPPVPKRVMAQNLGEIKLPDPIPCPKPNRPKKAHLAPQITSTPVTPPIPNPDEMTQILDEIKLPILDSIPCPKPLEVATLTSSRLDDDDDQDVLEIYVAMDDLF